MKCQCEDKLIQELEDMTLQSIAEVGELVFKFGHLEIESPERQILEKLTRNAIEKWQLNIELHGAEVLGPWRYCLQVNGKLKVFEHKNPEFKELQC